MEYIQNIWTFLLNIFVPNYCVVCSKNLSDKTVFEYENFGKYICDECLYYKEISPQRVEFGEDFFVSSFFWYSDIWIKNLIRRGKYKYAPEIFSELTRSVLTKILENFPEHLEEIFPKNSVLVPVPLHPIRQKRRGFNQSEVIAKKIVDYFCKEKEKTVLLQNIILRKNNTLPQAQFSKTEREKNIQNAFILNPKISHSEEEKKLLHIILVDDVVSTGSTLREVQKLLAKNGYQNISGFAIARGGR